MRISDWSSDVCSSDLLQAQFVVGNAVRLGTVGNDDVILVDGADQPGARVDDRGTEAGRDRGVGGDAVDRFPRHAGLPRQAIILDLQPFGIGYFADRKRDIFHTKTGERPIIAVVPTTAGKTLTLGAAKATSTADQE